MTRRVMNMQTSIVFAELQPLLDADVLVTEKDDTTLGYQQSQIVLLLVSQLGQLNAVHLGTDMRRQVKDLLSIIVN